MRTCPLIVPLEVIESQCCSGDLILAKDTFPGNWCGVPTVVGYYLIQSVPAVHGIVVLNIAHGDKPVEVSRVRLNDTFEPHWTGWDAKTQRIVVTGSEPRLYLLKFDAQIGRVTLAGRGGRI